MDDVTQYPPEPRSAAVSRRNMLIGGAMIAVAGASYARKPVAPPPLMGKTKLDTLIPDQVGPWTYQTQSGLVLPPRDQLSERVYDDLVTRVYVAPDGTGVMFLAAYSGQQDGMIQVHRPEVCYPASGYRLTETQEMPIKLDNGLQLPSRFIVAQGQSRTEQLIYWTRIGPSFPTGWLGQRGAVIEQNLKGIIPDGVLVRISTIVPDDAQAVSILRNFAKELIRAAPAKARQALIGQAS